MLRESIILVWYFERKRRRWGNRTWKLKQERIPQELELISWKVQTVVKWSSVQVKNDKLKHKISGQKKVPLWEQKGEKKLWWKCGNWLKSLTEMQIITDNFYILYIITYFICNMYFIYFDLAFEMLMILNNWNKDKRKNF